MPTTIRTPGAIDLTPERIQVGDTVAFVEKINSTQAKLEAWTAQDWNNFAADVAAVAYTMTTQAEQVSTDAYQVAQDKNIVVPAAEQVALDAASAAQDRSTCSTLAAVAQTAQQAVAADRVVVENIRDQVIDAADIQGAVEAASGGCLTVRLTDKGQACIFFKLPAFNCEDIAPGGELGCGLHPAFIKNGVAVPYILVGQHIASYSSGEFLSLPGRAPAGSRTYDQEISVVGATGSNFRQMNNYEWAAVTLWCMANGYEPLGNTLYGRSHSKRWETGVRVDSLQPGYTLSGGASLCGTGPYSWFHDSSHSGIADLVGNLWERVSGLKLIDGKYFLSPDGGDYGESEYINTGVTSAAGGAFSSISIDGMTGELSIPGWSSNRIDGLTIAANGNIVAIGYQGITARSSDDGVSWTVSTIPGVPTSLLGITTLFDGTIIVVGGSGAICRSNDHGVTWSSVQAVSGFSSIYGIAQAVNGDIIIVGNDGLFSRSTDNGVTWTVPAAISGWSGVIWDIVRTNNGTLIVVGANGLFSRSTDNGVTWSAAAVISGGGSIQFYCVGVEAGGAVYAGASSGYFSKSLDNGVTWSAAAQRNGLAYEVYAISPIGGGGLIWASGAANGSYHRDYTTALKRSLCIPASPSLAPVGNFYHNTSGERIPLRGGSWNYAGYAGLGALDLYNARSRANSNVGLRLAYRDQ